MNKFKIGERVKFVNYEKFLGKEVRYGFIPAIFLDSGLKNSITLGDSPEYDKLFTELNKNVNLLRGSIVGRSDELTEVWCVRFEYKEHIFYLSCWGDYLEKDKGYYREVTLKTLIDG